MLLNEETERLLWVLAFAVLICARMPGILIHGRFWVEAGWYFRNAWTMPWYDALTVTYGGYVSLVPALAGLLARHLVPLEYAPYVSTYVALFIQLCPAILLATARDGWLSGRITLGAALLLIAIPPASAHVWLATIHAQVHLALCAGLILALEMRGGATGLFRLTLLALAAATGPGAWALTPLFALRAFLERSRGRAVQAGILAAITIIQLLFFFHMLAARSVAGPRMQLLIVFVRHLLIPFLGHDEAIGIAASIHDEVAAATAPVWPMLVTVFVFGAFAVAIFWQKVHPAAWMLAAGVTLAVVGYIGAPQGALTVNFTPRYSFAPGVLFSLALLALASLARGRAHVVASALVVWLIVVGAHEYFVPQTPPFAAGPDWRSEVAAWRADPSRPLRIWPETWSIHLPPEAR